MFNYKQTYILFIILFINLVIIILFLNLYYNNKIKPVYCLMLTGHIESRRPYALNSIRNFKDQTYTNKHLIIINQSKKKLLTHPYHNILEVYVNNENKNLGELRNISLQFVPPKSIWTTWDDDDWRNSKYISIMIQEMYRYNVDFLMFQNRVEYNINNNFLFISQLKSGFMTFFCVQNPFIKFEHISTLEDVKVKEYALKNLSYYIIDNNPLLYIRLIHNSNTSKYVDPKKSKLTNTYKNKIYFEKELTKNENTFVNNIISKYYNKNVI